jgi:hypothetical protein
MGDLSPSRSQDDEAHESDGGEGGGGCADGDGGVAVGVFGDGGVLLAETSGVWRGRLGVKLLSE